MNDWEAMWKVVRVDMPGLRHLHVRLVTHRRSPILSLDAEWVRLLPVLRNLQTADIVLVRNEPLREEVLGELLVFQEMLKGRICGRETDSLVSPMIRREVALTA